MQRARQMELPLDFDHDIALREWDQLGRRVTVYVWGAPPLLAVTDTVIVLEPAFRVTGVLAGWPSTVTVAPESEAGVKVRLFVLPATYSE